MDHLDPIKGHFMVMWRIIFVLTPRLSEFEILNNATSIFQNRPVSTLLKNIFYNLNFAEEAKW